MLDAACIIRCSKFGFFITNVITGMGQRSEVPLFVKHVNNRFNFSVFESRFSNLFTGFKVVVLYDKKVPLNTYKMRFILIIFMLFADPAVTCFCNNPARYKTKPESEVPCDRVS